MFVPNIESARWTCMFGRYHLRASSHFTIIDIKHERYIIILRCCSSKWISSIAFYHEKKEYVNFVKIELLSMVFSSIYTTDGSILRVTNSLVAIVCIFLFNSYGLRFISSILWIYSFPLKNCVPSSIHRYFLENQLELNSI